MLREAILSECGIHLLQWLGQGAAVESREYINPHPDAR